MKSRSTLWLVAAALLAAVLGLGASVAMHGTASLKASPLGQWALETFGAHAGWVGDYWRTRTRKWFLWLPTGHCYQHLGEAITLRTMVGVPWAP